MDPARQSVKALRSVRIGGADGIRNQRPYLLTYRGRSRISEVLLILVAAAAVICRGSDGSIPAGVGEAWV